MGQVKELLWPQRAMITRSKFGKLTVEYATGQFNIQTLYP